MTIKKYQMLKFVIVIFIYFYCANKCLSQQIKYLYEYEYNTQFAGLKKKFSLYYWVDSSIIYTHKNKNFYKFNLTRDSIKSYGLIALDETYQEVFFLSDTSYSKTNKIQKIYSRQKRVFKNIKNFPFIEREFNLVYKKNQEGVIVKLDYKPPSFSHLIYVTGLKFNQGSNYPSEITLFFPFESKNLITLSPLLVVEP